MKHFLALVFFSALVSTVFGITARDTPKERAIYGMKIFAEFVGIGLALAWLLYFLPL
jgi:hypothetical protein